MQEPPQKRKGLLDDGTRDRAADRILNIILWNILAGAAGMMLGILHPAVTTLTLLVYCVVTVPLFLREKMRFDRTPHLGIPFVALKNVCNAFLALTIYGVFLCLGMMIGYVVLGILLGMLH